MILNSIFYVFLILIMDSCKKNSNATGYKIKHSDACKVILEDFAAASADFILCTVLNARPVNICLSCVENFNDVMDKHDQILNNKNSSCNEKLINQDRIEVIESGFMYVKNLWNRGQCKNCFESKNILSNDTKEFIKLYSDINSCLESNYNLINKSYSPDVCSNCSEKYYKMSKFYTKLKASENGSVCIDIVDSANVTQNLWSNVLHCGETVMTFELILISISTVFLIIPVIFYLCAWKFTTDRPSAVLNTNRVSQRFRERWRSRGNSWVSS